MRFDLDQEDLKLIGRIQRLFSEDDTLPASLYRATNKLVRKLNSQMPDPIPAGAKRRIKTYDLSNMR